VKAVLSSRLDQTRFSIIAWEGIWNYETNYRGIGSFGIGCFSWSADGQLSEENCTGAKGGGAACDGWADQGYWRWDYDS